MLAPEAGAAAAEKARPATVQPNPAVPGGRIWIADAGCATGTATSPALTTPIVLTADELNGPGTLRDDLISGVYTVTLHCDDTSTATVRVIAPTGSAGVAAPQGAAGTDDGSASDHLGIGDAALGSAFILGGIAFGITALVRRRRTG
jgi:hypothetical protein